ncbi:MAG: DNA-binding protein [Clostridiales bacterium]|nr:DNA-binding protein [Clostridiales bacterium]
MCLGFDTSNYTTSAAFYDGGTGRNESALLPVREGELGLRQSEALFNHVKMLPDIVSRLGTGFTGLKAVGASSKPRQAKGSYMPCFLAGVSVAKVLSEAFGVPYVEFSHQQGHLAAAAWSAGCLDLLEEPFLAWHLSGGTTELLYVSPKDGEPDCQTIGGTTDLSAGQLIDRTGKLLGIPFPSGSGIDELAMKSGADNAYKIKTKDLFFSLSGMENMAADRYRAKSDPADISRFVLSSIADLVYRVNKEALGRFGSLPILYSGGVSASNLLRAALKDGIFSKPEYACDNAIGIAILTNKAVLS